MSIKIIPQNTSKTINWSGGTSTELFIYPHDADFQERKFLFRISTATVAVEESTFTRFENVTRTLMVLKGKLELKHEGHHSLELNAFDQDTFQGHWNTSSKGKVTDFNLMCKEGSSGTMKHHHVQAGNDIQFDLKEDIELIYLAKGEFEYHGQILNSGDIILAEEEQGKSFDMNCNQACDIVHVSVSTKEKLVIIYPSIIDRVKAVFADSFMLIIFMFFFSYLFTSIGEVPDWLRIGAFAFVFALYDPIFTSILGGTIGHHMFGIRVKRVNNREKNILFPLALIRFVLKTTLGWISLLTINSSKENSTLHDMAVNSVVVFAEKKKLFSIC